MGKEGRSEKGERNLNLLSAHVPDTVASGGTKTVALVCLTSKLLPFLLCISALFTAGP